jgi:hypothetical protein
MYVCQSNFLPIFVQIKELCLEVNVWPLTLHVAPFEGAARARFEPQTKRLNTKAIEIVRPRKRFPRLFIKGPKILGNKS